MVPCHAGFHPCGTVILGTSMKLCHQGWTHHPDTREVMYLPALCCVAQKAHMATERHFCWLPGTTLHAQAGCGIINMWNDFGKMWQKPAIEKWQAIKVQHQADCN